MGRQLMPSVMLLAMLASAFIGIAKAQFEEDVPWLLAQRDAFSNWPEFSSRHNITGWDETTPLCSWSCIDCNSTALSYELSFVPCTGGRDSQPRVRGTLTPELGRCRSLSVLTLSYNELQGTLPPDWGSSGSFTKLQWLSAFGNNLTGTLPASWGAPGAFPALRNMAIDDNQFTGTLPPEWGAAGAFPQLYFLSVGDNLTGTVPFEWGQLPSLEYLHLSDNDLTGTLHEAWGLGTEFQKLVVLNLGNNTLTGTLPAWSAAGAFPRLERLVLESNNFVGTVPDWKANGNFPELEDLLIDANPGLCGVVPASLDDAICDASLSVSNLCSDDDTPTLAPCPPPAPPVPPAAPPPPPTAPPPAAPVDASSSGAPVGAIAGGVTGGVVALAVLAFLAFRPGKGWLRRKAAGGGASAADALESGGKGAPPGAPLGSPPAAPNALLPSASSKQNAPGVPGSVPTEPAVDTFIQAKAYTPEPAFGAALQPPPPAASLSSGATGSRGPPTPPAGSAAVASLPGSTASATSATISHGQRSAYSQPMGGSAGSLEGDVLLSIIASHLSARQRGEQQPLQPGPDGGDSAVGATQLGSAVQGWEVAWEDINVEQLVGRGAFGMVYMGRWNELPVAVKVLVVIDGLARQGLELPDNTMRALQQEASVMARMRHPHIVSFLGLCTLPPAIITEYCPRGSVYENLREGLHSPAAAAELTWRRRLSMAHDAAMGLLYLHRRGLIHRDVKSPNLLVTEHWRVQVGDVGLAKILGPVDSESTSVGGPSNPQWLAPEVVQGDRASAASDVFSYGMVLLELLTWRLPWRDTPPWQIALHLREGRMPEVPTPETLPGQGMATAPGLDAFCQLIRECWALSPEARPTFADIVPRLRALLEQA